MENNNIDENMKIVILSTLVLFIFTCSLRKEDMVFIPAGEFLMGCNTDNSWKWADAKPPHRVYLDAYYIDRHEVTETEFQRCVEAGECMKPGSDDDCTWGKSGWETHPITCVKWKQAEAFCQWAGKRLPTEAEWEKAARGTDGRIYPWGNEVANCEFAVMDDGDTGCGKGSTWEVCSKPKGNSPYGLCDMAGNVSEWVKDRYSKDAYNTSFARNPLGPSSGNNRILRGGSWYSNQITLQSFQRIGTDLDYWDYWSGFRCARSISK